MQRKALLIFLAKKEKQCINTLKKPLLIHHVWYNNNIQRDLLFNQFNILC